MDTPVVAAHSSTLRSLTSLVRAASNKLCDTAYSIERGNLFCTAMRAGLIDAIGHYHDACELEHPVIVELLLAEQIEKDLRLAQASGPSSKGEVSAPFTKAECDVLTSAIKVCLSFGGGVTEAAHTAKGLQATLRYHGAQSGSRIGPILTLASHITLNRQVLL